MSRFILPGDLRNAPRDPFTIGAAIVTALSSATGVVLAAEAFILASTIVGTVAVGGLIAGAQFALSKTLSDKGTSGFGAGGVPVAGINAPEVRGSVRQSDPSQRIIYGQGEFGGAVSFLDDSKPPNLYLQLLMSARKISALNYLKIGANLVPFREFGMNQILEPIGPETADDPDYEGGLRMSFRPGDYDQTVDQLLADAFPNLTADGNFRQRAIASAMYEFDYGANRDEFEERWGLVSVPNPLLGVDGAPVYDPRDAAQRYPTDWNDIDDVLDAMATWQFRREAALVQGDWLGYPDGINLRPDRIRWDEIAKAADFDGESVSDKSGTVRMRHPIDGIVLLNQKPRTVMEAMLTANRGFVVQSRGRGWVASCRPRKPRFTLTDKDLAGGFRFRNEKGKRDVINQITARIPSEDRENKDIDIPVLKRPDYEAQDGELLAQTVRLPYTREHSTAQRLAFQYVEESRLPRALSVRVPIRRGLGIEIGDVGTIDSRIYPRMNAEYTVEEIGFLQDFSAMVLNLVEYDSTIARRWNPQEHEQDFTPPDLDVS